MEATEWSTRWPVVSFIGCYPRVYICVFVEGPATGLEMAKQAGLQTSTGVPLAFYLFVCRRSSEGKYLEQNVLHKDLY